MKLNLGSSDRRIPGFLSVDIDTESDPDFLVDLTQGWPWGDGTIDEVLAVDVFEHLPDKRHTMNELWRVLKIGGTATLVVPHATLGDGGHCDPTHVSYWTQSDFEYYVPYDKQGKEIAERQRFRSSTFYNIKADFEILNLNNDGHIPLQRHTRRFGGYTVSIHVELRKIFVN